MATATRFTLRCQLLLLIAVAVAVGVAVPALVVVVVIVIVYPFCHIYLVGLESASVEGERRKECGPVQDRS